MKYLDNLIAENNLEGLISERDNIIRVMDEYHLMITEGKRSIDIINEKLNKEENEYFKIVNAINDIREKALSILK